MNNLLKFGKGNAKLDKQVYTFSLPSGYTCPFAEDCLSKANKETGKITDGEHTQFRCFSASQESLYKNVRDSRWRNFELVKQAKIWWNMSMLIVDSLPKDANIVRIHVGGDFFSDDYFQAWLTTAQLNPNVIFYAYTKSLRYWVRERQIWLQNYTRVLPCLANPYVTNFRLTASFGGRDDSLIAEHSLRSARVVYSEAEANALGLEIDHNDSHAIGMGKSFALLLHGVQPKGTIAAKALSALKAEGKGGYNKKNRIPLEVTNG